MERRKLARTELTIPRACFGAMTFGSQTSEADAGRMIDLCLDRGINFFDTANNYNQGESEAVLGRVVKGRRGQVMLASKAGNRTGYPPDCAPLSRKGLLANLDASLGRLQTDHLDIFYLHLPDYDTPLEETLAALEEAVRAGKVRYPAVSNFASWQHCRLLWIADKQGYPPPVISQPMYNLLARGIEQEYLPFCKEMGVSTIVYNPLAGGLLTGKQRREEPLPGTRFDKNQMYLDRYWHPAYFDAVEELRGIAKEGGRSLVGLAFAWLLHHTQTDCVILGASRVEQLEQNLQALDEGRLDAEVVAACDAVWQKLRGVTPKYNR